MVRVENRGGDGPHYSPPYPDPLHRNSSFGMASLRPDGFVALRPRDGRSGSAKTIALKVTGPKLLVTADTAIPGATLQISIGSSMKCDTLSGENVTDYALRGCNKLPVGSMAVLELVVTGGGALYTIGFGR